jgi:putative transposase
MPVRMHTNYPRHLGGFSYMGHHRYSLTFCTANRACCFTTETVVTLVRSQILRAASVEAFTVVAYCFMPDHLHLVVEGATEDSDLKRFVKLAKQFSGFQYKRRYGDSLWQRYSYEHVIRHDESFAGKIRYVLGNPVRAGLVTSPGDYPYLGSESCTLEQLFDFAFAQST